MNNLKVTLSIVKHNGDEYFVMQKKEFTFMGAAQYVMDATKFYTRKMKFDKDFFQETRYVNILVEYGSGIESDVYIQWDVTDEEVVVSEM